MNTRDVLVAIWLLVHTVPAVGKILRGGKTAPLGRHLGAGLWAGGEDDRRVLDEDLDDLVAELDVENGGDGLLFGSAGNSGNWILG